MAQMRSANRLWNRPLIGEDRKCSAHTQNGAIDPECARKSWQRIGGGSPPRGRFSQPPRPRVMHEALLQSWRNCDISVNSGDSIFRACHPEDTRRLLDAVLILA